MAKCGLWFGIFQGLMPLIGYFVAGLFAIQIESFDHWIAFLLLALIGANMLKEAFSKEEECDCKSADFSFKTMLTMAIATSIDAAAVGVSLALSGEVNIVEAVLIIAVVTCIISALGVKIGSVFGDKFEKKAQENMSEDHLWGPRDYYKSDYYTGSKAHFVSEIGYHGCPSRKSIEKFIDKIYDDYMNDRVYTTIREDAKEIVKAHSNDIVNRVVNKVSDEILRKKSIVNEMPKKSEIANISKEWQDYFMELIDKAIAKRFK
jgi:putative Mn2+ efflux pump MntP